MAERCQYRQQEAWTAWRPVTEHDIKKSFNPMLLRQNQWQIRHRKILNGYEREYRFLPVGIERK